MSLVEFLELLCVSTTIRVHLQCELSESLLDLISGRILLDTKDLVIFLCVNISLRASGATATELLMEVPERESAATAEEHFV